MSALAAIVGLAAAASSAWQAAPDAAKLRCVSPMASAPMTLSYDRPAGQIVVRESMAERRQAAEFTEDGFSAVFESPVGSKTGYLFTYHGETGVLNVISFRPSRGELAEMNNEGQTSAGQTRLIAKYGKKSMRDITGAMFMNCTPTGN